QRAFTVETIEALKEGGAQLERAASLGHCEALTQLAHFTAAGINAPPNWDKAADMLVDAALRGSALAEAELRLLGGDARIGAGAQAGGGAQVGGGLQASVGELRGRIDFRAAIAPRPTENLSEAPRIRASRGFMSREECRWVVERGRDRLRPAEVYDQAQGG